MLYFFKMNVTEFDTHTEVLYGRLVPSITVTFTDILVLATVWDLWLSFDIYKDSEYFRKGLQHFTSCMVSLKATFRDSSIYETLGRSNIEWDLKSIYFIQKKKSKQTTGSTNIQRWRKDTISSVCFVLLIAKVPRGSCWSFVE